MSASSDPAGRGVYPRAMRALHWVTPLLLAGSYTTAWTISSMTTSAGVQALSLWHRSFGAVLLCLTLLRLAVRWRSRVPKLPPDIPFLQQVAARLTAAALYGLLLLQPLLGIVASMLHGGPITLLGGITVPSILPPDRKLAHRLFEVHGTVALLLLGLIGMHAAAALYHYFIRRDGVLTAMLPGVQPMRQPGSPRPSAVRS